MGLFISRQVYSSKLYLNSFSWGEGEMDIVIYGTGRCGQYVFNEIGRCEVRNVHVRGWIDNHTTLTLFHELPVMNEKIL